MRRSFVLLLAVAAALARGGRDDGLPEIDGKALLAHVKWLADDEREGRASGSPGAYASGDYIAQHFRGIGLAPGGDDDTFFQKFDIPRGFEVRPTTALEIRREKKSAKVEYGKGLKPMSLSGPGDVTADVVFAGYGIAAPELGYDDYAGLDVKGKVVVVMRRAPAYEVRKSPFSNAAAQRRYAAFRAKVATAVGAGAAALVIVNDPKLAAKRKDDVALEAVGGNPGSIPVFHVTYRAWRKLAKVCRLSLQKEQAAIDRKIEPRSRALEGVTMRAHADLEAKKLVARNVCALLTVKRATGQPREALVVGGHYDHLGRGEFGSLAGSKGRDTVHNGADDNASGTAAVMEVATFLAARREALRRDVVFVLFSGEEMGLLGSKHYVEHPAVPLEECVAMINLDMVGRLGRGKLQIGGTGTSPVFPKLLDETNRRYRVKAKYNPGGRAPSDNMPFYEKSLPVLFFFTGLHSDYHRPDDDWKKVDRRGMEKVVRLAADVCLDLASREKRLPFTRSDASGLDAGPRLGLSLEQRQDGVYVLYVEPKSPASFGRVKVGDKVEEFADTAIDSITRFNEVHSRLKDGQKVTIAVRRGARLMTLRVKLG